MDMITDATQVARHEAKRQQDQAAMATARGGEYLSFRLGTEEYGIDILLVQEIRSYEAPTRIANAPRCVKGVVNLRGVIVPIVDLRDRFGCLEAGEREGQGGAPVIIVLDFGTRVIGVIVDAVSDVLAVQVDQIKPASQLSSGDATFISGIACSRQGDVERLLILLNMPRLMAGGDLAGLLEA